MSAIYSLCDGTEGCLVSPMEIKSVMSQRWKLSDEELDDILNALRVDGYFDLVYSERKGEKMYVINLRESGFAWKRTKNQRQREVSYKIFLAFIGALATFIFGLIMKGLSL